jgi:hypothetical protein
MAESTLRSGRQEMKHPPRGQKPETRRVRKTGGGRKPKTVNTAALLTSLDAMGEPTSRGDPRSPLRWTCKSTRQVSPELSIQGQCVSQAKVGQLLAERNSRLPGTRKRMEGRSHADRTAQFEFINKKVVGFQRRQQPAISIDPKKKELIGRFANGGKEYQPKGHPEEVET